MNTEQIINNLINKLDTNHNELMQIAKDQKYTNDSNREITRIFQERTQLFTEIQKFKAIISSHQ